MEDKNIGFQTSVLGFKKADVLSWIEEQSKQAQEKEKQTLQARELLEQELNTLKEQQTVSKEALLEKQSEISALERAIETHKTNFAQQEEKLNNLAEELQITKASERDFKERLFAREEDAVLLRKNNQELTQELCEKDLHIEKADELVKKTQTDAEAEIEKERKRFVLQNAIMKDKMKESAASMVGDIDAIKADLSSLEERILESMMQMQQSTQLLAKTLENAEKNIETLGVKMDTFPKTPKTKKTTPTYTYETPQKPEENDKAENFFAKFNLNSTPQSNETKKAQPPLKKAAQQTLSTFLLKQISKMLDD